MALDGSESEESREGEAKAKAETAEAAPAPQGAVLAEAGAKEAKDGKDEAKADAAAEGPAEAGEAAAGKEEEEKPKEAPPAATAKKEDPEGAGEAKPAAAAKPSYTLHIRNFSEKLDLVELETRLKRHGDVVSLERESDALIVAKFSRTNDAYKAREKLNGANLEGSALQVDFGPQDAEHYQRGKKRMLGKLRKAGGDEEEEEEEEEEALPPKVQTRTVTMTKAEPDAADEGPDGDEEPEKKAARKDKGDEKDEKGRVQPSFPLNPPSKPVSKWSTNLSFEEQLEDFMKMPRRGMYNRYLVLGKLPPELRTGEAIWRAMHPVQRDIVQIEMLTCFGKPVAHISLRSATAAAFMHRLCEQAHSNLTVAFAPPRRHSATLWLGNVDDFVPRKELEALLGEYGRVLYGLRYLPARTCAFATFQEAADAVVARNTLYGLEVQRNQYLNVDFVHEGESWNGGGQQEWGMWGGAWAPPWAAPPWGMRPWGPAAAAAPWAAAAPPPPQWRGGERRRDERLRGADARGAAALRPPAPGPWGVPPCGRSPPRAADRAQEKRTRRRHSRSRSHGRHSDREARSASETVGAGAESAPEAKPKARVKLYKMGEFCCNIVANYVKGKEGPEPLIGKLHIDQRTKVDHCRAHLERAGPLATVWHFSAADRRDCAAYDALCDYFVEKQRVGLVQTPSYYIYIVPPTKQYLKDLALPTSSNFVVGLQIPIKK